MNTAAVATHPLIASAVPGRLRLRDAGLRRTAPRAAVETALRALDGVVALEPNAQAGSVVVRYDAGRVAPAAMLAGVLAAAAPLLGMPARATAAAAGDAVAPPVPAAAGPAHHAHDDHHHPTRRERKAAARRKRHLRHRVNLAAKIGMLASLGTSLVLAAAGVKKWHAATGVIFVGLLAVHLATHRKHILR